MTPEQREQLNKLYEARSLASQAYEASRLWNIAGLSVDERAKQDAAADELLFNLQSANAAVARAQIAFAPTE